MLCAAQTCGVIVDSKDVVGRRRRRRSAKWRVQASPTRPEQPSLASVGGGLEQPTRGSSDLFQPNVT